MNAINSDYMLNMDLKIAVICSINQNRSIKAHNFQKYLRRANTYNFTKWLSGRVRSPILKY